MLSFLIAATPTSWNPIALGSWQGSPIIIIACLLMVFITSRTIDRPHVGPKMPLPFPELFNNMSVAAFLGAMSFGHILGVAITFGLSSWIS